MSIHWVISYLSEYLIYLLVLGLAYHLITTFEIVMACAIAYGIFFIIVWFMVPGITWIKYWKYKNLEVSRFYNPIFADLFNLLNQQLRGKANFYFLKEATLSNSSKDMRMIHANGTPVFYVNSKRAIEDFVSLQSKSIDRADTFKLFYAKMYPGAADQIRHNRPY